MVGVQGRGLRATGRGDRTTTKGLVVRNHCRGRYSSGHGRSHRGRARMQLEGVGNFLLMAAGGGFFFFSKKKSTTTKTKTQRWDLTHPPRHRFSLTTNQARQMVGVCVLWKQAMLPIGAAGARRGCYCDALRWEGLGWGQGARVGYCFALAVRNPSNFLNWGLFGWWWAHTTARSTATPG